MVIPLRAIHSLFRVNVVSFLYEAILRNGCGG